MAEKEGVGGHERQKAEVETEAKAKAVFVAAVQRKEEEELGPRVPGWRRVVGADQLPTGTQPSAA